MLKFKEPGVINHSLEITCFEVDHVGGKSCRSRVEFHGFGDGDFHVDVALMFEVSSLAWLPNIRVIDERLDLSISETIK